MSDGDPTPRKQGLVAPWEPGRSGNPAGRPKGSRSRLGEGFLSALHDDFLEHGAATIERMRQDDPSGYIRVIASLLPRHFKVEDVDDARCLTDEQLDQRITQLATFLDLTIEPAVYEPVPSPRGSPIRKLRSKVY